MGSTRDGAGLVAFEERYVEDRVDFHGGGKLESVGLGSDTFDDAVRAEAFPVEFLRGALGADVRRQEPDFIINLKFHA